MKVDQWWKKQKIIPSAKTFGFKLPQTYNSLTLKSVSNVVLLTVTLSPLWVFATQIPERGRLLMAVLGTVPAVRGYFIKLYFSTSSWTSDFTFWFNCWAEKGRPEILKGNSKVEWKDLQNYQQIEQCYDKNMISRLAKENHNFDNLNVQRHWVSISYPCLMKYRK